MYYSYYCPFHFYAHNLRNVADDCAAGRGEVGGVNEPVVDDDLDDDLDDEQEEIVIMTTQPHPAQYSPVETLSRSKDCTKQQR